jgi:hypothetical protein
MRCKKSEDEAERGCSLRSFSVPINKDGNIATNQSAEDEARMNFLSCDYANVPLLVRCHEMRCKNITIELEKGLA